VSVSAVSPAKSSVASPATAAGRDSASGSTAATASRRASKLPTIAA
jgi:hypothetical protein